MCEIWKDIKDYEELYQVSNLGRIRSINKIVFGGKGYYKKQGKLLNLTNNGNGYLYVTLCKNGIRKNHLIHRLVAETFISNPNNLPQINHKNYIRHDNRVENLEWISIKENIRYSLKNRKIFCGKDKNSSTGYRYICKRGNRFEVTVKRKYLGTFSNIEEAIEIRDKEIKRLEELDGEV